MNYWDYLGLEFKDNGVEYTKSLKRLDQFGFTFARAVLLTKCFCKKGNPDTWHKKLRKFEVQAIIVVRTHLVHKVGKKITYKSRSKGQIARTVTHEKIHLENYKKWHDDSVPGVKFHFDSTQNFASKEACEKDRKVWVACHKKSWKKAIRDEISHRHFTPEQMNTHGETGGDYDPIVDDPHQGDSNWIGE